MGTMSFWARQTSSTANATTLVIQNTTATQLTFTTDNPNTPAVENGDLILESTNGAPDPDTWVIVNGVGYTFTYDIVGTSRTSTTGGNAWPLALRGKQIAVIRLSDGRAFFFPIDGSGTQALMNQVRGGNERLDNPIIDPPPTPVCFAAGTEIATPSGLRTVESLRVGDSVLTEDGRIAQVAWMGISDYSATQLVLDPGTRPVCIPAHALGPNLPERDLVVSPQHRIVVEGAACELLFGLPRAFVIARHLLGSIARPAETDGGVTYVHLMLDQHEIVVSNGLPTESFQPARRMLDLMTGENLERLDAALNVLGAEDMLSRPDALPTLSSREAKVFIEAFKPHSFAPALAAAAGEGRHLH